MEVGRLVRKALRSLTQDDTIAWKRILAGVGGGHENKPKLRQVLVERKRKSASGHEDVTCGVTERPGSRMNPNYLAKAVCK